MLHLAIICIACAVAALNGSIAFIDQKNNEFNTFGLSDEEKENIARISSPFYNVDTHNFSDCDTKKITNRTNSSFYDYIIKQYRNSRSNSCNNMENVSMKNLNNLNVDFTFSKKNLLWKNDNSESGFKKDSLKIFKKKKCQNTQDKEKTQDTQRKLENHDIKESKPEPGKCQNSSESSHQEKKHFFKLKNLKRFLNRFRLHKKRDENKKCTTENPCRKIEAENEPRKENTIQTTKKINFQKNGQLFSKNSNNSVLVYNNNKYRPKKENNNNSNGNNSNLNKKFRLRDNYYRSKHLDRNSAFSVNLVRRKKPVAGKTGDISFYDTPKTTSTILNNKLRKNRHHFCSENRDLKLSFRKNYFVKPYPYSTKFKSRINLLYPNEKFFPRKKRKRHYYVRRSALPSLPLKFENWPFFKKFVRHHLKIYKLRKKRHEELTSTKTGSTSKFPYSKISSNLEKSVKSNPDPANTDEVGEFRKKNHQINSSLSSTSGVIKEINTEASKIFNPTQKYKEDILPDHTIEKPFLHRDSLNQMDQPDFKMQKNCNLMTDFPLLGPTYHQFQKHIMQTPNDKLIPLSRYVKIRHELRKCLMHNALESRIKRTARVCTTSRRAWSSAPLLCIPYIRRGQEDILRYLINLMEKMIGKPFSKKRGIFEKTKFKPQKDLFGAKCDYSDEYNVVNQKEIFPTNTDIAKVQSVANKIDRKRIKGSKLRAHCEKISGTNVESACGLNVGLARESNISPVKAVKIKPDRRPNTKTSKVKSKPFKEITDEPSDDSSNESDDDSTYVSAKKLLDDLFNKSSDISSNESIKESFKEAAKESSKELAEEAAKELSTLSAKESCTESVKESSTESAKELSTETAKNSSTKLTQESSTESFKESAKESPKKLLEESSKKSNDSLDESIGELLKKLGTSFAANTVATKITEIPEIATGLTTMRCDVPTTTPCNVPTTTPCNVPSTTQCNEPTTTSCNVQTATMSNVPTIDLCNLPTTGSSGLPGQNIVPGSCTQTNYNAPKITFSQIKPESQTNSSPSPSLNPSYLTPDVFPTVAKFPIKNSDPSSSLIITTPLNDELLKNDPLIFPNAVEITTQNSNPFSYQPLFYTPSVLTTPFLLSPYYPGALAPPPNQISFSDNVESSTSFYKPPKGPFLHRIKDLALDVTPNLPSLYTLNSLLKQKDYFSFTPPPFTELPDYYETLSYHDWDRSTINPLLQNIEIQDLYENSLKPIGYHKKYENLKKTLLDYPDSLHWPLISTSTTSILDEFIRYPGYNLSKRSKHHKNVARKYHGNKNDLDYGKITNEKGVSFKDLYSSFPKIRKSYKNKLSKGSLNAQDTKHSNSLNSHGNHLLSKSSGKDKMSCKKLSKKLQKFLFETKKNKVQKTKYSKNHDSLARRKREDDYIWPEIYSDYLDEPRFKEKNLKNPSVTTPQTSDKNVDSNWDPPFYDMFNELAKAVSGTSTTLEVEKQTKGCFLGNSEVKSGAEITVRAQVASSSQTTERFKLSSDSKITKRSKVASGTHTTEPPKASSPNLASENGNGVAGNSSVDKTTSNKGVLAGKAIPVNATANTTNNTFNNKGETEVKTTAELPDLPSNFTRSPSNCSVRYSHTTPNPSDSGNKTTIKINVSSTIHSKATRKAIASAKKAEKMVPDVVPANIAYKTKAKFIDTSNIAGKATSLVVPHNTNHKMITSTAAPTNITDKVTVTTASASTADKKNLPTIAPSNIANKVTSNINIKMARLNSASVNIVDKIMPHEIAPASFPGVTTEQTPTNAANITATIITSIKIVDKKIADNVTPADFANKKAAPFSTANKEKGRIDAPTNRADDTTEQIVTPDKSTKEIATPASTADKSTEPIVTLDKSTEQIDPPDNSADKETEQTDASGSSADKEAEQIDAADSSTDKETKQIDAPDNNADTESEQVDVSDNGNDKEAEEVDASDTSAEKLKEQIDASENSNDKPKKQVDTLGSSTDKVAAPMVATVTFKGIVSSTLAINTSKKTGASTITNAKETEPNGTPKKVADKTVHAIVNRVKSKIIGPNHINGKVTNSNTTTAATEIIKPKNFSKENQTLNILKNKTQNENKKSAKIRQDKISTASIEKKNSSLAVNFNHSLKHGVDVVLSSKNTGKLTSAKGADNSKLEKTNSKVYLSDLESPTEKNSKKDSMKENEEDVEDFGIGDGQVPTTLKTAVIIKGVKKIIAKPAPKLYSRVYPDSFDFDGITEALGTTPIPTSRVSLGNKTALGSSSLKPDIRLQLLAVCEGYLETIRRIRASNQTWGENLDADLAQYCENVISQSFSNQVEKPKNSYETPFKTNLNPMEEIEKNAKIMSIVNASSLQEAHENGKDFNQPPVQDKILKELPPLPLEYPNENCDIKVRIKNCTDEKSFKPTEINTESPMPKNKDYLRRPIDLSEYASEKEKEKKRTERRGDTEDEEDMEKGVTEDQFKLLKLLPKRIWMPWLRSSKDQSKTDDFTKTEYLEYEDFISTSSEYPKYSGTIKSKRNDKDIKRATESLLNSCKNTLYPIYAKHYGYDKSGELRQVEVLWRSINRKTHEEKILKNMSVVAFLAAPTINPYDESKVIEPKDYHGEEMGDIELKNGRKIGLANEMSDPHAKSTTVETDVPCFLPECTEVTPAAPEKKTVKKNKTTYMYIRKPDLRSIVGALPHGNRSHNISRKVTQKLGIAKDIFQEYSIEFLNYAVYILPAMFTILFLICCFGCAIHILKTTKSFRYRKKRKKRAISSEDTSDTSDDSEESRSKRKREAKRKKRVQKDAKNETSEKTLGKKFWNVLKMPSTSSKDVNEDRSRTERKHFLKFLRRKAENDKVTFADDIKEVNSEALERRELISLLEELKKIELEKSGERKEVKSVYVQYGGDRDENPFSQGPEFSYPYERNVFGLPKGYFFFNKKFPNQHTNTPIMRDFELYGNASETTDLLPCEHVFHAINNDCFSRYDFRLNQEGGAKPKCKVYRDSGVNKRPFEETEFIPNESENQNIIFDKYKNVNLDTSEEFLGMNKKNKGTEIRFFENASSNKLLCNKNTDLSEEMENMKHHKKKYVRLKDDGVLCRL